MGTNQRQRRGLLERKSPFGRRICSKDEFSFDVKCFFKTIVAVLKREGMVEGTAGQSKIRKKRIKLTRDSSILQKYFTMMIFIVKYFLFFIN